ncbi:DoxX family protein [uncultured Propionibacterium sp.]|uniref:DoxX family protein n=1 Tax=uncultured Propionibacterium sp. TaxID=218066 RepID=UPI00292E6949|nr:DoxX family protein [uncultured Propionibacterium sp.]
MSLARFASRSMLASVFITRGLNAARNSEALTSAVDDFVEALPHRITDLLPAARAADLVRVNGWMMVGAGSALALGVFPRLASALLAAQLVPTTLTGHPFWSAPEERTSTHGALISNVALAGGLLTVALGPKRAGRARGAGNG